MGPVGTPLLFYSSVFCVIFCLIRMEILGRKNFGENQTEKRNSSLIITYIGNHTTLRSGTFPKLF